MRTIVASIVVALVVGVMLFVRPAHGSVQSERRDVVKRALQQVGKPYVWGAAGPGAFDCSGLTMYAYRAIGVRLLHWTGFQIERGVRVAGRLRPADLLFFHGGTHVGLYVGGGRYVEAPHTGARVTVHHLVRSSVYEARRIIR